MAKGSIAIIGRGIIGLTTAYRLLEKGYEIKIIDDSPYEKAASWNNAGLISPLFSAFSPSVGTLRDIMTWIFSRNSGIRISISSFFKNLPWVWEYSRKSSKASEEKIMKLLYEIIKEAVDWYRELSKKIYFSFKQDGLLEVYIDKAKFEKRILSLKNYPKLGKYEILDGRSVLNLEPNLNKHIIGGIFYPEEASLDPRKLMHNFSIFLRQNGVEFLEQRAISFKYNNSEVSSLVTNKEEIKADYYIIATGAHKDIYKSLKLKVPVIAGRGYAIITDSIVKLEHHIVCGDFRVSISQLDEGNLKATGFLEFADINDKPMNECFEFLRNTIANYIPAAKYCNIIDKWLGSRPCTPDLMPIIDKIKDNLLINVGHCRIGVCLAPFSSKLILEILEKGKHDYDSFLFKRFT